MRRRKALGAAADEAVRDQHGDQLGRQDHREATSPNFVMQALAVYDGQTCIGHLLPRGKAGVETFDADDKWLGIFPDQKQAADAVTRAAAGGKSCT